MDSCIISRVASTPFASLRAGGNLNYEMDGGYALAGSLDYRLRDYHAAGRRNDSDLRWNGAFSRTVGEANWAAGVRGRVSYRGDGQYRNDFGAYGNYRLRVAADDQLAAGLEVRQRRYANGPLRERTRNIVEATGSWTRAFLDGKASFTLAGQVGRDQHRAGRRRRQLLRSVAVGELRDHREARRLRLLLVAERPLQHRAARRAG